MGLTKCSIWDIIKSPRMGYYLKSRRRWVERGKKMRDKKYFLESNVDGFPFIPRMEISRSFFSTILFNLQREAFKHSEDSDCKFFHKFSTASLDSFQLSEDLFTLPHGEISLTELISFDE